MRLTEIEKREYKLIKPIQILSEEFECNGVKEEPLLGVKAGIRRFVTKKKLFPNRWARNVLIRIL